MDAHEEEHGCEPPSTADPEPGVLNSDPDPGPGPGFAPGPDTDPAVVRNAIRARGEEIKRAELRQTFDRIRAQGTITEGRREVVTRMATAIVDGVLSAPDAALADTDEHDPETVRTALALFDPDR